MKPIDAAECETQILVCTNERPEGRDCCKKYGGQEFYDRLKKQLKETGKNATHWATRTGCLGYCNNVGTTITIHRKGKEPEWLSEVTNADFETVWKKITETDGSN